MRFLALLFLIFCLFEQIFAQIPELIVQRGHSSFVRQIAFSPSTDKLVSISQDEIVIWDLELAIEVGRIESNQQSVTFGNSDDKFYTGGSNGIISIWDLKTLKRIDSLKTEDGSITSVIFLSKSEESLLVTGSVLGYLSVFDLSTMTMIESTYTGQRILSLVKSPDGDQLISNESGIIRVWNPQTWTVEYNIRIGGKPSFSENGKYLFMTHASNISVWETKEYYKVAEYNPPDKYYIGGAIEYDSILSIIIIPDQPMAMYGLIPRNVKTAEHKVIGWNYNTDETATLGSISREIDSHIKDHNIHLNNQYLSLLGTDGNITIHEGKELIQRFELKGNSGRVMDISFNSSENYLAISGPKKISTIFDLVESRIVQGIPYDSSYLANTPYNLKFTPGDQYFLSGSRILSIKDNQEVFNIPYSIAVMGRIGYFRFETVLFHPNGKYFLSRKDNIVIDYIEGDTVHIIEPLWRPLYYENERLVVDRSKFHYGYDSVGIYEYDKTLIVDPNDHSILNAVDYGGESYNRKFHVSKSGDRIVINRVGGGSEKYQDPYNSKTFIYDINSGNKELEFTPDDAVINYAMFSFDDNDLICFTRENNIEVRSSLTGELTSKLKGHNSRITDGQFILNNKFFVTSSFDGTLKFWNWANKTLDLTLIPLTDNNYVAFNEQGLFDASSESFDELHYKIDSEIVSIGQLKDRFYEPGLIQKALGFSNEPLRKTKGMGSIELFPAFEISHPNDNNGLLGIDLANRGGGIGKVLIWINGKEVTSDARSKEISEDAATVTVNYQIEGHPYLKQGEINDIEIKVYNKEGYLSSRSKNIKYISKDTKKDYDPALYGLIIGSSNYSGDQLDLQYASKDANEFANALKLTGDEYFNEDKVSIDLLTTDNSDFTKWPTKENIENAFKKISTTAKPYDVLVVYLSGHGINYGGSEGDFYYLTSDASSGDLKDPAIRQNVAISSSEFTEYIKMVPALKQVMIMDACHAGQLAENIMAARSDRPSSEIRALERMKDRTGTYILAGSAADAVSYEASVYGQGLLTYSLLFGMKGAALREDKYVDIMELFQFCADNVPKLAENIGGIQKPEVRVPYGGQSFDIGLVTEEVKEKIELSSPKPLFVRSSFQNEETFNDDLRLSEQIDELLREHSASKGKDQSIVFVDAARYSEAYSLKGRYTKTGNEYLVEVRLFKGDAAIENFKRMGESPEEILNQILAKVEEVLNQ